MTFAPCVFVFPWLSSYKDTSYVGLKARSTPRWLYFHLSNYILQWPYFQIQKYGSLGPQCIFFGGHNSTHKRSFGNTVNNAPPPESIIKLVWSLAWAFEFLKKSLSNSNVQPRLKTKCQRLRSRGFGVRKPDGDLCLHLLQTAFGNLRNLSESQFLQLNVRIIIVPTLEWGYED